LYVLCLAHTQHVRFNNCATRDNFQKILTSIDENRKKNASLTCVFGPTRTELDRQDVRQSNILWDCISTSKYILFN